MDAVAEGALPVISVFENWKSSQPVYTPWSRLIDLHLPLSTRFAPPGPRLTGPSRFAPSLPGSLRVSAKLFSGSSSSSVFSDPIYATSARRVLGSVPEEHLVAADSWPDDFEEISYDELRASILIADPSSASYAIAANPSIPPRSRSSASRLRKLSRLSLKKPCPETECIPSAPPPHNRSTTDEVALVLASPKSPISPSRRHRASTDTAPVDDSSSAFYDSDPFRKVESPTECEHSGLPASLQTVTERLNPDEASSPPPCVVSPPPAAQSTTIPDSDSAHISLRKSRKSLKRLTTFTKTHLLPSSRKCAPEVRQIIPGELTRDNTPEPVQNNAPLEQATEAAPEFLPQLSFEQVDFSSLFSDRRYQPLVESIQVSEPDSSEYFPRLQLFHFERVDPRDLTASPPLSTLVGFSPSATPVHSPSWLSRNVKELEPYTDEEPPLPIPPPPSPPLHILPRSLLPVRSRYNSESQPASPVRSSVHFQSPPSPIANRLSVIHYRQSFTETSQNITSLLAHASDFTSAEPPTYLVSLAQRASRNSQLLADMSHNGFGKAAPTIDYGEEVDYTEYEWFKDPPPRPEPAPPPVTEQYVPQPGVIEQNEMFDFALKSAPNVLYARYKQYGQLGALAWCSEFSELIDALKELGFRGNMFVSTRSQALTTCEEILKLKLKIDMQIILMVHDTRGYFIFYVALVVLSRRIVVTGEVYGNALEYELVLQRRENGRGENKSNPTSTCDYYCSQMHARSRYSKKGNVSTPEHPKLARSKL
ncbi:predicted protein [Postia placenta Mad-698-R]|nr:predicted protein [Postia placenta Mad-698-R]